MSMQATIERNWDDIKTQALQWITEQVRREVLPPVTETDGWLVVGCQSRREYSTARWLRHFGSTVFLPNREVELKGSNRLAKGHRHRGLVQRVLRPLFPGYFFAQEIRRDPRDIPGFRCALRSRLVDGAVATLQEVASDEGLIKLPEIEAIAEFSPGDIVQITGGPFWGFGGVVIVVLTQRVDAPDRIRADVEIFGRLTPVELYFDQIRVVAKKRATASAVHDRKADLRVA
jgi:transcription antitermination factor NusG